MAEEEGAEVSVPSSPHLLLHGLAYLVNHVALLLAVRAWSTHFSLSRELLLIGGSLAINAVFVGVLALARGRRRVAAAFLGSGAAIVFCFVAAAMSDPVSEFYWGLAGLLLLPAVGVGWLIRFRTSWVPPDPDINAEVAEYEEELALERLMEQRTGAQGQQAEDRARHG